MVGLFCWYIYPFNLSNTLSTSSTELIFTISPANSMYPLTTGWGSTSVSTAKYENWRHNLSAIGFELSSKWHTCHEPLFSALRLRWEQNKLVCFAKPQQRKETKCTSREVWRDCKYNHLTIRVAHPGLERPQKSRGDREGEWCVGNRRLWVCAESNSMLA